jgi:hypothetical protein
VSVGLPSREVTDQYVQASGRTLDFVFDVDLGEQMPEHHVVARGIGPAPRVGVPEGVDVPQDEVDHVRTSNATPRDQVHFEHVPGLTRDSTTPDWWFTVSDDVGTAYSGVDEGAYDWQSGGPATHAVRELGGKIPPAASQLTLHFLPGHDRNGMAWNPPEPWRRELVIDLRSGKPVP